MSLLIRALIWLGIALCCDPITTKNPTPDTIRWRFGVLLYWIWHSIGANPLPRSQVPPLRPSVWVTRQSAMEPSPALAWLLLLSLVADCLKAAQSRDFTVKDIIYLHPSTTPYPGGFKCFTCEKAADNYECNRWAPDIYCPRDTRYCYTQHTMEVTGNSISVTKRCVPLEECLSTGCRDSEHEGYKICTSCCEGNICNLPLPRNDTDATFATTSPINQTNGHPHCVSVIVSCLWVWLGLTL